MLLIIAEAAPDVVLDSASSKEGACCRPPTEAPRLTSSIVRYRDGKLTISPGTSRFRVESSRCSSPGAGVPLGRSADSRLWGSQSCRNGVSDGAAAKVHALGSMRKVGDDVATTQPIIRTPVNRCSLSGTLVLRFSAEAEGVRETRDSAGVVKEAELVGEELPSP